mmetsp:Transcript_43159/g.113363  ORF Transcript_43159/g.113363 Transcript_43159/m.113363 type:complete len:200 (-) Transcript_43159:936-1535(-)
MCSILYPMRRQFVGLQRQRSSRDRLQRRCRSSSSSRPCHLRCRRCCQSHPCKALARTWRGLSSRPKSAVPLKFWDMIKSAGITSCPPARPLSRGRGCPRTSRELLASSDMMLLRGARRIPRQRVPSTRQCSANSSSKASARMAPLARLRTVRPSFADQVMSWGPSSRCASAPNLPRTTMPMLFRQKKSGPCASPSCALG